MTWQNLPADDPQRVFTAQLIDYLNAHPIDHAVVLGALITCYRSVALQFPCCLAVSAGITGTLSQDLKAAYLGQLAAQGSNGAAAHH